MDANARPDRARVVTQHLEWGGIECMDWPVRSPDQNPIGHVLEMLQRQISARPVPPQSLRDLTQALLEELARLPRPFQKLVRSFNARCREAIECRWDHSHY